MYKKFRTIWHSTPPQFLVVLIFMLALFFRLYQLDRLPPGLHHDEVINGQIVDSLRERFVFVHPLSGGRQTLYQGMQLISVALLGGGVVPLRLPSVVCGMAAVMLAWWGARRVLGSETVGLLAAAGMAVSLWGVMFSRLAIRTILVAPVAALTMLAFWEAGQRSEDRIAWGHFVLAGFLAGLSAHTYTAGLPVIPIAIVWALYALWRRDGPARRRLLAPFALAMLVMALVAAPVAWAFLTDPALRYRITEQVPGSPYEALLAGDAGPLLANTAHVLGMFFLRGDPQWHYNVPYRPIFDPVSGLAMALGLLLALRRWREPRYMFWVPWFFIGLGPSLLSYPVPHSSRIITSIVPAFVFFGLGLAEVLERLARRGISRKVLAGGAAVLIAGGAVWTFRDYFGVWKTAPEVDGLHQTGLLVAAHWLDAHPEQVDMGIGGFYMNEDHPWWRSGRQTMTYMLAREDARIRWFEPRAAWVLREGMPYSISAAINLDDVPDLLQPWIAGLQPAQAVRIDADLPPITLYRLALDEALTENLDGKTVDGGPLALLGYDIDREGIAAGRLEMVTVWQVKEDHPPPMKAFLHLLDEAGDIAAQDDRLDVLTDALWAGDIVLQIHQVPLDGVPPGAYRPAVGMYNPATQERLPLEGGRAVLEPVAIP